MKLQDIKIETILVDYHRGIWINNEQLNLKPIPSNRDKIMLLAYLAAHTTQFPPMHSQVKGFTWHWAKENIYVFLNQWNIAESSFRQLWYDLLKPETWSPGSNEAVLDEWSVCGQDFLKKLFISESLKNKKVYASGTKGNRMHLPDNALIKLIPAHNDVLKIIPQLRNISENVSLNTTKENMSIESEEPTGKTKDIFADNNFSLNKDTSDRKELYGKRCYDIELREQYLKEIVDHIANANKEIVFVGGISQSLLNPSIYKIIAKRLQEKRKLKCRIYYESNDNLFRRSQYCERSFDGENFRSFKEMLRRKEEIERLAENISKRASLKMRKSVKKRVIVKQLHLQLYLIVTRIDELIYVTPMSHRRNSQSITICINDQNDPLYKMGQEYIEYLSRVDAGSPYCTEPDDEIVQIFDDKGIPRGYCGRNTLDQIPLRCKVVFGFLFNPKGELLLQKRGPEALDNRGLWDKSFGGHMKGFRDTSIIETVERELSEELACKCAQTVKLTYLGNWNLHKNLNIVPNKCLLFKLYNHTDYSSLRKLPGNKQRKLEFNVNAFAILCPCTNSIGIRSKEVSKIRWVDLSKLKRDILKYPEKYTDDLRAIMASEQGEILEKISYAIKSS